MNWDDVRFLLVLGRERSLAGSARQLQVNQTTVGRRLKALETQLGLTLFEKVSSHWAPTTAGERMIAQALRIEEEMNALLRMADLSSTATASGVVRITAVESIVLKWLTPHLDTLYQRYPDLQLELVASDQDLNLGRREADIALRLARPEQGNLLIRKLASCDFGLYQHPSLATDSPHWVAYDRDLNDLPESRWLAKHHPLAHVRLRSNHLTTLQAAIESGTGKGLLPHFMVAADSPLVATQSRVPGLQREIWLLVHPELRHLPRIDAVCNWLGDVCFAPSELGQAQD